MNNVFSFVFLLSLLYSLIVDQKKMKKAKPPEKVVYYAFFSISLLFFIALELELNIPMPTKFVVYKVVPQINQWLHLY